MRDMNTVNSGAELFTVSVNDTATNFSATSPSTTVENLKQRKPGGKKMFYLTMHSAHFIQLNQSQHHRGEPETKKTVTLHYTRREESITERERNVLFNDALNTFYSAQPSQHHRGESETRQREREMFYLTTHSTHFIQRNHPSTTVENLKPDRERERNVLFNNALNTFYSAPPVPAPPWRI